MTDTPGMGALIMLHPTPEPSIPEAVGNLQTEFLALREQVRVQDRQLADLTRYVENLLMTLEAVA